MKIILYARVSTRGQAERGYSLRQQVEALRTYAQNNGMNVLDEITDDGYSGIILERPGLDRIRDLVAASGVDLVLAQDRDRFAREPAFHYLLETEFGKYGTRLAAINDWGGDTPEGQLLRGILDQVALHRIGRKFESESIPTVNGSRFWNVNTIRRVILQDVHRPHSYNEIKAHLSAEVVARLDPEKCYGISWYNRRSTYSPNSKTRKGAEKPREDWIAVPVPNSGRRRES
jgi:site-specific DNA recombinase